YSLVTSIVGELYAQLIRTREIQAQRDRAELAMFKAQISPHFLFNTLNSLYSLVIGTSQKAEDAFIKFTDILKYTYVTIENETVAIGEEAEYIGNYIDLQRIRLNDHTKVTWTKEIDDDTRQIPPMLMLTFVENAFKYGASTSRDCAIAISLKLSKGHLEFRTRNSIMKHADQLRTELPRGIENCRARLEGIYPGRHSLITTESDGVFNLRMTIELD
ncbi:MAG: sensor histidine kinase, partial [Muribaculaceae bacterium]|nr:sensor histidine kinase [Muribaculaceae bacterium]